MTLYLCVTRCIYLVGLLLSTSIRVTTETMIKSNHKYSGSKVRVCKHHSEKEYSTLNDELDLPDDSEDTTTILSEMAAQKAIFDSAFSATPDTKRVRLCAESTLKLLPIDPEKFETKLLVFCLSYCLGNPRLDLIPEKTSESKWTRKSFEALSIGWMRWMVNQDDIGVLYYVANMLNYEPRGEDKSFDTLILNFWAKAIELMVLNRPSEAKRFFERANEVGTQVGTSINPSICWTYAMSFYRLRGTR